MARLSENSVPSYRLHKSSGRAVVTIDGRDIYLGIHGTPESREEYDRVLRLWLTNGRRLPDALVGGKRREDRGDVAVVEVISAYWEFAEARYTDKATRCHVKSALSRLRKLFGPLPVAECALPGILIQAE